MPLSIDGRATCAAMNFRPQLNLPRRMQLSRRTLMKRSKRLSLLAIAYSVALLSDAAAQQQPAAPPQLPQAPNMTFFVTGSGPGKGADLGGLDGADQHCQQLAQ